MVGSDSRGVEHAFEWQRDDQYEARCGLVGRNTVEGRAGSQCMRCWSLILRDEEGESGLGRSVGEEGKADTQRRVSRGRK